MPWVLRGYPRRNRLGLPWVTGSAPSAAILACPFGAFQKASDLLFRPPLPETFWGRFEELREHVIDGLALGDRCGAGELVDLALLGRQRLLTDVVLIEQTPICPVLEYGQVRRVTQVVPEMMLVVVDNGGPQRRLSLGALR